VSPVRRPHVRPTREAPVSDSSSVKLSVVPSGAMIDPDGLISNVTDAGVTSARRP